MGTARIIVGLKINLILFHIGAAGQCTVSVSQPPYLEVDYTQEAVIMECSFDTSGCPPEPPASLWFRYGAQQTESLCEKGCQGDRFTEKKNMAEKQVSLTVSKPTPNDSAIYICGIAFTASVDPGAKRTGNGTLLAVRDTKILSKSMQSFLIAVLALLSVYIAGMTVVFIILPKTKSKCQRNKETEDSQKKMSARRIFQEIAQELYNKRHMETSHPPDRDNTYENRSALSKYERP
ncbi:immunoglobulin superfamily member 6 [Sorex araneus]|uniref:immunoglobulin superfamily member 6 n=1 Tax=Sorex araneus TaxID=42254 RepID=UPI002433F562|nr:immunoglobulin superfamily member 6 [Sorex araneus]